jgi:hypothetical protein
VAWAAPYDGRFVLRADRRPGDTVGVMREIQSIDELDAVLDEGGGSMAGLRLQART